MLKYQKKSNQVLKNNMQSFLRNLDVFAQPPTFGILKHDKFTTSTGFFCSAGMMTVCLIYLVLLLLQLYNKENPSVVFSETQMADTTPIPITIENFTLGITMANLSLSSLTTLNQTFTIKVQNCKRVRTIDESTGKTKVTQNCTVYPTEACTDKHFVTEVQKEYFSKISLGYTQCLNYEMWVSNPPILQGVISGNIYQYLSITVQECKNTTNFTSCAPKEKIDSVLNSAYYAVHLSDNLVQMKQSGYPFQNYIQLQYTTASISNSKTIFQTYKLTNAITDGGYVTTDEREENSIIQYSYRETQESYNNNFILLHYITLDQRQAEYLRQYEKVQGILSTIGGLYQVLFLTISALLRPVIVRFMNLQMANKLFRFEDAQQIIEEDLINEQQQDLQQQEDLMSSPRQQMDRSLDGDLKKSCFSKSSRHLAKSSMSKSLDNIKDSKAMQKFLKQKKQSLNLTLRDIIVMNLGCRKKEQQQIDYATDKFMSKLDVAYIISKIYEIDKLKLVLLNEDQLQLFNYLPKPVIPTVLFGNDAQKKISSIESNKAYQFILQDEKSDLLKLKDAFLAFQKLQRKQDLDQVDENILQILDEDIIELFQSLQKDQNRLDEIFNKKLNLNLQVFNEQQISNSVVNVEDSRSEPNPVPPHYQHKSKP